MSAISLSDLTSQHYPDLCFVRSRYRIISWVLWIQTIHIRLAKVICDCQYVGKREERFASVHRTPYSIHWWFRTYKHTQNWLRFCINWNKSDAWNARLEIILKKKEIPPYRPRWDELVRNKRWNNHKYLT